MNAFVSRLSARWLVPLPSPTPPLGLRVWHSAVAQMYQRYNAVMRGTGANKDRAAREAFMAICKGNTYTTTIWALNSAIIKLGKLTQAAKVYRGVSGRTLPSQLKQKNRFGVVGAVDFAFISTTLDRDVARAYARTGGILFEIQQGLVDRGCDVSWLSQYPFEREILFAPLTGVELVQSRVEDHSLVLEMRVVVNQAAPTIDKVVRKLQHSHVQFLDLLMEKFVRAGVPLRALLPLRTVKASALNREPSWFNQAKNYMAATEAALVAKMDVFRMLVHSAPWDVTSADAAHAGAPFAAALGSDGAVGGAPASGDAPTGGVLAPSIQAEQMFLSAELSAAEGEVNAALSLLQLSLACAGSEHPRLRKDDERLVEEVLQWVAETADEAEANRSDGSASLHLEGSLLSSGSGGPPRLGHLSSRSMRSSSLSVFSGNNSESSGSAPTMDLKSRLLVASMLLGTGHVEPWPSVLAGLAGLAGSAAGDASAPRALVRLLELRQLLPGEQLEPGQAVLASEGGDRSAWLKGQLVATHAGGADKRREVRWQHSVRLGSGETLTARHVLLANDAGGVGALLRAAAARSDGLALVDRLIHAGLSVAHADRDGSTALHVAAAHAQSDICRRLRDAGAEAFACNQHGVRAYDIAMHSTSNDVRVALKPTNMHLELSSDAPQPALSRLARQSETELIRALDERQAQPVDGADANGVTPLMIVCAYGLVGGAAALLEARADPALQTRSGCTALTMAAERGHVEVVEALLREESQRRQQQGQGVGVGVGVGVGKSEGVSEGEGGGEAERRSSDPSALLVNISETHDNTTALMRACQCGNVHVASVLISHGAHLNVQRKDTRRTALTLAARNGSVPCVSLLLNAQANATICDREGMTPLLSAARFGHAGAIERLVKTLDRQSLEQPNHEQETPLLLAAMYGHESAVRTLLLLGAKTDARDAKGFTPLMWVCWRNHELLLPFFAVDGAPLDATNADGHTALMLCSMAAHVGSAEMLIQANADPSMRGPGGATALMLACRCGDCGPELIEVFLHGTRGLSHRPGRVRREPSSCRDLTARAGGVQGVGGARRRKFSVTDQAEIARRLLNATDDLGRSALMHAAECRHASTVRSLLLAGADRLLANHAGYTAMMLACKSSPLSSSEADARTLAEFHGVRNALLEQDGPPLCAYEGKSGVEVGADEFLGVGSVLIDMGTGESKLLAALRFESVALEEMAKHKIDMGESVRAGAGHPTDRSRMTPAFAALTGELRRGLDELARRPWFSRVTWTHCFVGATAWYRELKERDAPAASLADRWLDALQANLEEKLAELGMPLRATWGVVHSADEGRYEAMAVEHAMRRSDLEAPIGVLAGGSGSVQLTALDSLLSFVAMLRRGEDLLGNASRSRAASLELWRAEVVEALGQSTLVDLLSSKAAELQEDGGAPLRIVFISSFYHTAVHAGLVGRDRHSEYLPAQLVDDRLRQFELAADLSAQPKLAKEVVNAARIRAILNSIFDAYLGKVECLFARDWTWPTSSGGAAVFRLTWTAGWWLDQLVALYKQDTCPPEGWSG